MDAQIRLRPDLFKSLQQSAQATSRSVEEVANEAVEDYLREQERRMLEAEMQAFRAMHAELVQHHLGQWVAVHKGRLIDSDGDLGRLHQRIRQAYPQTAILIQKVETLPERDIAVRSPRLEA